YKGGYFGDPETWGSAWFSTLDGLDGRFRLPGWRRRILVNDVDVHDNVFDMVKSALDPLQLTPGVDHITKITFVGHGSAGAFGNFLTGDSDFTADILRSTNNSPQKKLLSYLKPF